MWMIRRSAMGSLAAMALALGVGACQASSFQYGGSEGPPVSCATEGTPGQVRPECWPKTTSGVARDPAIEARVRDILSDMTLEQKVGQIIQGDIAAITPADAARYHVGSVLNGGNSGPGGDLRSPPQAWLDLADAFWEASVGPDGTGIPLLWGTDAVHGHANIVGATIFPHNIGLGATGDSDLIRRIGEITAREIAVTGLDWTFAPVVAVARDDRWGRTYEGYAEDPKLVARLATQMVLGLQGEPGTDGFLGSDKVIATMKHYIGDGGTKDGVDQGDTLASEAELRDIHAAGYPPAIEAGVQTVMASFNSWHGRKLHGHKGLMTDVLVGRLGFDGFTVGDWNGHGQVAGCSATDCPESFNAGVDMYMAPDSWQDLYRNTLEQARSGEIPRERLDEAVSRILRVKLRAGLMDKGRPSSRPLAGRFELLGAPAHRAVAREAARKSLVLLKNTGVLPIKPSARVLVAGDGADSMTKQTGGWTLSWQGDGNTREHFPNAQTIFEGLEETLAAGGGRAILSEDGRYSRKPDVAIVVFGEDPYAEFRGDRKTLDYRSEGDRDLKLLRRLKAEGIPVVSVFLSGRPLWANPEINASDAFVAAWLPGSEGGAIADLLIGDAKGEPRYPFTGTLSFSWPNRPDQYVLNPADPDYDPLFPLGYGLTWTDDGRLSALSEDFSVAAGFTGVLFNGGKTPEPWTISVREEGGVPIVLDEAGASTRNGALEVVRMQRVKQEDSITLTWNGTGRGELVVMGPELDWTREANGDVTLQIDYRLDREPSGAVDVGMSCGNQCGARLRLPRPAWSAPVGSWGALKIPLKCFAAAGQSLEKVTEPVILGAASNARVSVSRIALGTPDGAIACPR